MRYVWRVVSITILMMFAAISGLFFYEEVKAGTPVTGDIIVDTLWSPAGSPYWIEDDVTVVSGVNLTIMPGVEVLFKGDYELQVLGDLYTVGDAMNRVIFTLSNPSPWPTEKFQIGIRNGGNLVMEHSYVSYATLILNHCTDIRIIDSEFSSSRSNAIDIAECDEILIERAFVHDSQSDAIETYMSSNMTVVSSVFLNNSDGIDGSMTDSDFLIVDNTFVSQTQIGILSWGSNHTIIGNEVSGCLDGIRIGHGGNFTVAANDVYHNEVGITAHSIHNSTIESNQVSNNSLRGIHSSSEIRDSWVRNNTVIYNPTGILVWDTYMTTFEGNNISHNNKGMLFDSETLSNRIFHNTFINNTVQAQDDGLGNIWDHGYPSGGNYWSDYTGIDMCSGPFQDNCPDPDGIGDTPYFVDNDTLDRYPFTSPYASVPPRPPEMIDAFLSGMNLQNTTITWSISPDDGAGRESVVAYAIYRGRVYDPQRVSYDLIATLPSGSSTYTDGLVGEGDPSNYFYSVCAVDMFSNAACSPNQVGKFTRPLTAGPNLVSIPLIQSDKSIDTVLRTLEYDKAWSYDPSSHEWRWFMVFKAYRRGLRTVNHTMGLWVNVTSDSNLTVAGIVPAQTTMHLQGGWNLVSFPSFDNDYAVADLKVETGAMRVEGFDLVQPNFLRVLGNADILQAGEAYWVKVGADVDWIVEVS